VVREHNSSCVVKTGDIVMDSGVLGILAKFPVTVVETKDSGLPTRLPVLDILGDATGVGGNAVAMMGVVTR
jgi:hypothetical protein